MRRSTRIRWEIPVLITGLDPSNPFSECCETVAVNAHGCGLICSKRLERGTLVKLGLLPNNYEAGARVVDVVPLGEDGRTWLLGLQLDAPANVWGVKNPPADWENAAQSDAAQAASLVAVAADGEQAANEELNQATGALQAKAAAANTATGISSSAPVSIPVQSESAIQSNASVAVLEPESHANVSVHRPSWNGDSNGLLQQLEAALRSRANLVFEELEREHRRRIAAAGGENRGGFQLRERDWNDVRRQLDQHLQDLLKRADQQIDTKLQAWSQKAADTENRLEALTKLQNELRERIDRLAESATAEASASASHKTNGDAAAVVAAEAAPEGKANGTEERANQAEEIRKLQVWMQSLTELLPQVVEQHMREALVPAETHLGQNDERIAALQQELSALEQQLKLSTSADRQREAAKALELSVRNLEQELRNSLKDSVAGDIANVHQELQASRQEIQDENDRLRKLRDEWAPRFQELHQANETLQLVVQAPEILEQRLKRGITARVEQVQSQLKNEIAHLKNDLAELSKACASVSSKVAEQADQGAARLSQELKQAAESMVRTAGEDAISGYKQQLESEFNQQHKELQNAAASVREEMSQLGSRFAELNMRMEEVQRARDSVHSLIGSLSQASTQHLQESTAAAADTIRVQLEQELGRVRQQVDRESAKFEELARQRQQASLEALEHHVAGLHATSETMLQKSTAEMNASLNQRIEKDLDAQRQEWEQQRQKMREESKAHAGQLSTELESKVQETMARAASDNLNEMQVQLERAADDVLQKKVAEAEAKLQMAFDSLVIDGERTRKGIEKLVESARVENRQVEAQRTALRAQLNDADTWVAEQTEQFRKSLHDVLLEATGEIKGRIHMAVEMSKEPIEKRSRHAQAQLEELAARKTRELTQQITELEKAAGPMLQARLNQALGEFQNNADQLAKASVDRYEDELVQTLDSMLHVLRSKRSVQSGPTSR